MKRNPRMQSFHQRCSIRQVQHLDSILQLVVDNNPELKALHLEYDAELMRKDQVSQLPNPTLGVGVPIFRPETRLGPQVLMISASQMFPWFGTNKAKEDVVISMSKSRFEKIELSRLQLFKKVQVMLIPCGYVLPITLVLLEQLQ